MRRTTYLLEDEREASRLERQSATLEYSCERELAGLVLEPGQRVLDAGCGSGLVTRFLGERFPASTIVGCDFSDLRLEQARRLSQACANVSFRREDLLGTSFETAAFDVVICRYVLQHVPHPRNAALVTELARCLKPGGELWLVDGDGIFVNLFPMPPLSRASLSALEASGRYDFNSGRKLVAHLSAARLETAAVTCLAHPFTGEALKREIEMNRERFGLAAPALADVLGSEAAVADFTQDFLEGMAAPGSFYYHTVVVARGRKAGPNDSR